MVMDDFPNSFTNNFTEPQKKLLYEAIGKAAIFEWQIKLFLLILDGVLYLESLIQKTKAKTLEIRNKNGKFQNLSKLVKLMFKHYSFSKEEQSYIEEARKHRNELIHFNLMKLLNSLDQDQELSIIGFCQKRKENTTSIFSDLHALNTMVTHEKFINRLHTIFEQAIKPIENKRAEMNLEIERLGKIAHERNLFPKTNNLNN